MHRVIERANALGIRTVVGGPAPTTAPEEWTDADIVFAGEAECRIDELVAAITGERDGLIPAAAKRPAMTEVPIPRFDLLDRDAYTSVSIQYSRGCPYHCEFCDIVEIFGRTPRVKSAAQVLAELDALHQLGHRGAVFFVDDNFIGHKRAVKELLAELEPWQEQRGRPFTFYTEASVNLASDRELTRAMVRCGFNAVFLGIETPHAESLAGAGKKQNLKLDLTEAVDRLTRAGLEVYGGFIVGFDEDGDGAFEAQRAFLDQTPIPLAMIGLLTALPGTRLARRLTVEGRIRTSSTGDQFGRPNFDPKMDERTLIAGYRDLMKTIYAPDNYYARCRTFVDRAGRSPAAALDRRQLRVLARAVWAIGVRSPRRRQFWRLLGHTARRAPRHFAWAVRHAVMGEHLIRYTDEAVLPRLDEALREVDRERRELATTAPACQAASA
jgi:radical SAM superfamily enzyme YgiQ (UPF0313 family)